MPTIVRELELANLKYEIRFVLLSIAIITFALLLTFTNTGNVFAVQYLNHTSDKYQIQFQIPSDWEFKEKTNRFEEGTDIVGRTFDLPGFSLITIGRLDNLISEFGSKDLLTGFYDIYKQELGDYTKEIRVIEKPSFINIDGQKAGTFLITQKDKYGDNAVRLANQLWVVYVGDHGYLISFGSTTDQFDSPKNIEIRDHFIKSIKFLGANNQTITNTTNRFDTSNNSTFEDTSNNSTFEHYQNRNCPPMSLVLCTPPYGGPRCPNGYHRSADGDCEPDSN
jgi:hypothetical protein